MCTTMNTDIVSEFFFYNTLNTLQLQNNQSMILRINCLVPIALQTWVDSQFIIVCNIRTLITPINYKTIFCCVQLNSNYLLRLLAVEL